MTKKATIKAISSYLPEGRVTNAQLAQEFGDWDVKKILDKTGISVRGLAGRNECASDLGIAAAQKLFDKHNLRPADVDFLIFCTQSPDYFLPPSACIIQSRLGLGTRCGAIDINQGCAGFIYALSLAKGLIESKCVDNVLLITAETYSKFINPKDRSVRTIFSDGAAATLVVAVDCDQEPIGPFVFGTDGKGANELIVPAGACRKPVNTDTKKEVKDSAGNVRSEENLFMNGPEIFRFTLETVPLAFNRLLDKAGLKQEDVDYYVFHQASKFMLEQLRRRMRIPPEKFCIKLESFGNTVSSTIPMALELSMNEGQIKSGDSVMLLGFGVGYSWAATMVKIT